MARVTGRRIALLVLLAVVAALGYAVHHYSRPERITSLLIAQLQSSYGLTLALPQPATVQFLPRLHLQLQRPVLTANSASAPIVAAERIEVSVPWSTLYGSQPVIERIEMVQPQIDIDALQAWLATQAGTGGATSVPAFTLAANNATLLRAGEPLATVLNLQLTHAGELGAWIDQWSTAAGPASLIPPMTGRVDAATIRIGETQLDGVKLRIDEGAIAPRPKP